jgi:hypothetical protein
LTRPYTTLAYPILIFSGGTVGEGKTSDSNLLDPLEVGNNNDDEDDVDEKEPDDTL